HGEKNDRQSADDDRDEFLRLLLLAVTRRGWGGFFVLLVFLVFGFVFGFVLGGLGFVLGRTSGRFLGLEAVLALGALHLRADQVRIGDENLVFATGARDLETGHGASPRVTTPRT